MRVMYVPPSQREWVQFYLEKVKRNGQVGHGDGFQGLAYQRGHGLGSIFKGLFRLLVPIGKKVLKTVGKEALSAGANIAGDLAEGRNFKDSFKENARIVGKNLLAKGSEALHKTAQRGGNIGKRKQSFNTVPLSQTQKQRKKRKREKVIKDSHFSNPLSF